MPINDNGDPYRFMTINADPTWEPKVLNFYRRWWGSRISAVQQCTRLRHNTKRSNKNTTKTNNHPKIRFLEGLKIVEGWVFPILLPSNYNLLFASASLERTSSSISNLRYGSISKIGVQHCTTTPPTLKMSSCNKNISYPILWPNVFLSKKNNIHHLKRDCHATKDVDWPKAFLESLPQIFLPP